MIFLLPVEWPEMPPYERLLTYYFWRILWRHWRPFLGHQAWSWTTLRKRNVFLLRLQTFFLSRILRFRHFLFLFERFYIYASCFPYAFQKCAPDTDQTQSAPVWADSHHHTGHDKTVLSVSCLAQRCELKAWGLRRSQFEPDYIYVLYLPRLQLSAPCTNWKLFKNSFLNRRLFCYI